jgi:thiamine pyrophosphokinase
MIPDRDVYTVIKNSSVTIEGEAGAYLSVFAIGGIAEGVTLEGLDYEVKSIALTPDFPLGVSNKFTENVAKISVKSGALLIIYQA